ncbi:MAG: rRNA adenine methyltransferase [Bacteroidia bacterium]
MQFDPDNKIVKLCAQGMEKEAEGKIEEASELFLKAWNKATNDLEKFISAHYVARHQKSIAEKLKWDETALNIALNINDDKIKGSYPSLYLNIAKGYEDMNDLHNALKNYQLALFFSTSLPKNGYGQMILSGINNGINRITKIQ